MREKRQTCIRESCGKPIPRKRQRRHAVTCCEECSRLWDKERRILKSVERHENLREEFGSWLKSEFGKKWFPVIKAEVESLVNQGAFKIEMKAVIGLMRMFYIDFHFKNALICFVAEEIKKIARYKDLIETRENKGFLKGM